MQCDENSDRPSPAECELGGGLVVAESPVAMVESPVTMAESPVALAKAPRPFVVLMAPLAPVPVPTSA